MKWLSLLLGLPFLLLSGGLLLNRPPLLSPPGALERLKTYLTTNVAETRPDHAFPELRPLLVSANFDQALDAVLTTMHSLGCQEIHEAGGEARAVVVSSLFRFRDDIGVRLESTVDGTLLHVRSVSRVGKGDLAANARHIEELFAEVKRVLAQN